MNAILLPHFGGQEFGAALADVLLGRVEPGGRLATTWPAGQDDAPVIEITPRGGMLRYTEDIHIGYRAWLADARTPAFEFGFGPGYTTWRLDRLDIKPGAHRPDVRVAPGIHRGPPRRWLIGFAPVRAEAGQTTTVSIDVERSSLAHWHGEWRYEPGVFDILVGSSVADLPLTGQLAL